jgi:hypothetical protein
MHLFIYVPGKSFYPYLSMTEKLTKIISGTGELTTYVRPSGSNNAARSDFPARWFFSKFGRYTTYTSLNHTQLQDLKDQKIQILEKQINRTVRNCHNASPARLFFSKLLLVNLVYVRPSAILNCKT